MRRMMLLGTLVLATGSLAAQELSPTPAPPKVNLTTDADRERFLLEAAIVRRRSAPGGITGSERATLRSADGWEHDAHIQRIDQHKMANPIGATVELDFHDSYRNNVAAYRLDRLIGLGMVPVTVVRHDGTLPASFTWWVDDVLMDEKARHRKKIPVPDVEAWNRQMYGVRLLHQLTFNTDAKNIRNVLSDPTFRVYAVDFSRAFVNYSDLRAEKELLRFSRQALERLRALDRSTLDEKLGRWLNGRQIAAMLKRRDKILALAERLVAEKGEGNVLY